MSATRRLACSLLTILAVVLSMNSALACHATSPSAIVQQNGNGTALLAGGTTTSTSVKMQGYSGSGTCGCGPYYLEFEVRKTSQGYTGSLTNTSPANNRSSCGAILYDWTTVSGLVSGATYKWRVREYASGSNQRSGWTEYGNPAFTVVANNAAPVADNQSVSTNEDSNKAITLTGSDANGNSLTYLMVSAPSNGSITGIPPSVTYNPNSNYHGSDSFTFKAYDGAAYSSAATVSITVNSVNDAPVALGQSVSTAEDGTLGITFAGTDADNNSLTWSIVSNPSSGTVTGGSGASRLYMPSGNYSGVDSFTFRAHDGAAYSNTATISITVTAVNDAPIASSRSVSTNEDTAKSITLVASDPESSSLTWTIVSNPSHGLLSGSGASRIYTPGTNFNGSDLFSFRVSDGGLISNTATVSLTVNPVNDAPVANPQSVTVTEDTPIGVTLTATDVEAASLTYSILSGPSKGSLTGAGASRTYTPNANATGSDSFTFRVSDGSLNSNTATVSIAITAVNDAPLAVNQSVTTNEDTAKSITLVASDAEGSALTFTIVTLPSHGALSGSGAVRTYTPGANFNGSDSFTFTASDGTSTSNTATVSLTVSAVNDAPLASNQSVSTTEDTSVGITLGASDVDADSLSYSIVSNPSAGSITGTGAARTFSSPLNWNGTTSFTFRVHDGSVFSNTATITIIVSATNDAPVANNQSKTLSEDGAASLTLSASDNDASSLSYSLVSAPSSGTLSGSGASRTYTPNTNSNGLDSFTWRVNDGTSNSNVATYTLTVTAVNDAPVASNQSVTTSEDTAVGITMGATDIEGDTLTYTVVSAPSKGTLSGSGAARTYTPNYNAVGADSFAFRVNDGAVNSNIATIAVTINPVNDAPVASNQSVITNEDTAKSITLVATDTESSGLTYTVVTAPSKGSLTGTGASRTYTPNANFNGTDLFTFRVSDGSANSNVATVNISVIPVNDAPVANSQNVTTAEDVPLGVTLSATDIEGSSLTYSVVSAPTKGTLSGSGASRTYTPNANWTGTDVFTFRANDSGLNSNTATVNITITAVSDAPTAQPMSLTTIEDAAVSVPLSGSDGDGDALTFSILSGPFNGSLSGASPNLTYTPNLNYNGTDVIIYKAYDGSLSSASVPVSITISAVNDAPVAQSQSVALDEDGVKWVTLVATDVESTPLLWTLLTQPDNGVLTGTAPNLTYAANLNFYGSDSFVFKVSDGVLDSNLATVSITVADINDAPIAISGGPYTANEGSALALDGSLSSDVDGSIVSWDWDCDGDDLTDVSSTIATGSTCTYAENGVYTLLLKITDDDGAEAFEITTVTVNNVAPIITSMVTPGGVEGFMLQFEASATDPGPDTFTFLWDFGNGSTFGNGPTQHTYYASDGTYTVTLTVTDDDGGATVQTAQVVITNANPTILGLSGDLVGDEGSVLSWTALAADPGGDLLTYSWDFGDGSPIVTGLSVSHAYADNGSYTLLLTVSDPDGGSSNDTLSIAVANVDPTIVSLSGAAAGDEGQGLSWSVVATDPGADTLSYSWSFGDGSPAESGVSGAHTYVDEGSYSVMVTVTDDDGGSVTDSMLVNVANVAPVVLLSGDESGSEGDLLAWTALVSDAGISDTFTYSWNFGDGSPVLASATASEAHVFLDEGSFDVALTVTDNGGAATTETVTVTITNAVPEIVSMTVSSGDEGSVLSFTASASDAGSDTLLYTWDFGDGTTLVSGDSVTHAYADDGNYVVTLTIDDGDGGSVAQSDSVVIDNVAPVIDALTGPATGPEGSVLQWNVQAFDAGSADVLTYVWDWGDGSAASSGSSASHAYADEGQYSLSVTVSDDDGASVSLSRNVEILNVAPVVTSLTAPRVSEGDVALLEVVAFDPGADTLTYVWDFGDGSPTSAGASQNHVYEDDGVFTVTVTIEDGDGGSVVEATTSTISNVAPEITALSMPTDGDEGSLLTFTVQASDAGALDVPDLVATWDFGDGTAAETGLSVQHAFPDDGQYTVTVVVDDQDGDSDSESASITIYNVDPQVLSNPPGYASEDLLYNYEVVILDPGSEEFILTLSPSSPAAMTVDSATQTINWTPEYADTLGPDPVILLTVDDGDGGITQQIWSIQVGFADLDGDGMADQWEVDHGLDPSTNDGSSDPDVDGVSTYQEFLDGTDPTVFDGPEMPLALSPIDGAEVDSAVPFLTWSNAFDPQLDELTYNVQVFEDEAMTTLIREELLLPENGWFESNWKAQPPFEENSTLYWRVRAKDAEAYGPFTALEEFFVNEISEAPLAPTPLAPLDGEMVAEEFAELSWAFAIEPDQDEVSYTVQVLDSGDAVLSEVSELHDADWDLHAIWLIDIELEEDAWYGWRVRATDEDGLDSEWSETQAFYYSLNNARPYDVYFTWPMADDMVEDLAPTLQASRGYDPEGQELTYEFELDSVASFDSEDLLLAEFSAEGEFVAWDLSVDGVLLTENQWYFARVRGVDPGDVASAWDTISFMAYGVNEAPLAPTLVNPAAGVNVLTPRPTLVANNVTDPEEDMVFYEFVVASDLDLSEVAAQIQGVLMGGGAAAEGQTAWTVDVPLSGSYFWAVRAIDAHGAASAWSEVRRLIVTAEPEVVGTSPASGCDCESSLVAGRASAAPLSLLVFALFAVLRRGREERV